MTTMNLLSQILEESNEERELEEKLENASRQDSDEDFIDNENFPGNSPFIDDAFSNFLHSFTDPQEYFFNIGQRLIQQSDLTPQKLYKYLEQNPDLRALFSINVTALQPDFCDWDRFHNSSFADIIDYYRDLHIDTILESEEEFFASSNHMAMVHFDDLYVPSGQSAPLSSLDVPEPNAQLLSIVANNMVQNEIMGILGGDLIVYPESTQSGSARLLSRAVKDEIRLQLLDNSLKRLLPKMQQLQRRFYFYGEQPEVMAPFLNAFIPKSGKKGRAHFAGACRLNTDNGPALPYYSTLLDMIQKEEKKHRSFTYKQEKSGYFRPLPWLIPGEKANDYIKVTCPLTIRHGKLCTIQELNRICGFEPKADALNEFDPEAPIYYIHIKPDLTQNKTGKGKPPKRLQNALKGQEWILCTTDKVDIRYKAIHNVEMYAYRWIDQQMQNALKEAYKCYSLIDDKLSAEVKAGLITAVIPAILNRQFRAFVQSAYPATLAENGLVIVAMYSLLKNQANLELTTVKDFYHALAILGGTPVQKRFPIPDWNALLTGWFTLVNRVQKYLRQEPAFQNILSKSNGDSIDDFFI